MYLSNRDIFWAIKTKKLIVDPPPESWNASYDETSIDLHLDDIREARIWDVARFTRDQTVPSVRAPELHLGSFNFADFSEKYLIPPPEEAEDEDARNKQLVCQRGKQVLVKPGGFLLWQTKEKVGTPKEYPELICFVNAKSTKARTGLIVHFTAPTIHAGWAGKITLEIANRGPFHFILQENDVVAQLTVAKISSTPDMELKRGESQTAGQLHVSGSARGRKKRPRASDA